MAQSIDPPGDNGGGGGDDPTAPGYVPPTDTNSKISLIVSGSSITITSGQISGAGGPWASFILKVTPINNNGIGTPAQVAYPPPT